MNSLNYFEANKTLAEPKLNVFKSSSVPCGGARWLKHPLFCVLSVKFSNTGIRNTKAYVY